MSKANKKKAKKKKAPKDIAGIIYFCFLGSTLAYLFIGYPILLGLLKIYGTRTEAVITSNTSTWLHRWTTSCYLYEYHVNGKIYDGNSLIEEDDANLSKIGTKVQVLYLDWFPSFNRPIYFWDD